MAADFEKLIKMSKELFFYGCDVDAWMPEIILFPFVSLQWNLNPLWYRMIAPPGSGKSEHLELLHDFELTYTIDELTPKSLMSGYRGQDGGDPSQLQHFDGKVIIVSDESTLMEQRQEDRNMVQSTLRRAYDGRNTKAYGNMKEKQEYKTHFNMLVGSTPSIDRYFQYQQQLGERFTNYRAQVPDRKTLARCSLDNQFTSFNDRRDILKQEYHKFIRKLPDVDVNDIILTDEIREMLVNAADFVALIRTHISRDSTGRHVTLVPQPETPGRLVKQMSQTAMCDAVLHGAKVITMEHCYKALYMGLASISAVTIFILNHIWRIANMPGVRKGAIWFTTNDIVNRTAFGRGTCMYELENLNIYRVLEARNGRRQGGRLLEYRLSEKYWKLLHNLKFFKYYRPPVDEIVVIQESKKRNKAGKSFEPVD